MDSHERIPAPWLRLLRRNGNVDVAGCPQTVFGHQIDRSGADRPSGVYVEWNWDGKVLRVRNDRAGMGQLLYATWPDGGGIALSPHVQQLLELGADSQVDDGATSVLIRLGFHLGVDTPFASIRALPPNAELTWRPGEVPQVAGQPHLPSPRQIARQAAVDTYIDLFRQSIARRPPHPGATVVPLTGGQDSRHILFELCRRGTPPDACVTVRPYRRLTYDDASVAADVARRLGVPHRRIDSQRSLAAEDFRKYRRIGPMSDEGGWTSAMLDGIRQFRCAYDGIAGDMLSSGYLAGIRYDKDLHELVERGDWGGMADRVLRHFSASEEALAPMLARSSFRDQGRDYVRERIIEQFVRVADTGHPLAMFIINNRTRREIAMMSWLLCSQISPYYAPYTDEDLFSFLASLPAGEFAVDQWFHREAIERGYPEWSDLPYFDKNRVTRRAVAGWQVVSSVAEINVWTLRQLPPLAGTVAKWGLLRLISRGGVGTAPRRVVQHWLALEQLLQHADKKTAGQPLAVER